MATLGPKQSAELICKSSKHVTVTEEGVAALAGDLLDKLRNNKEYIHFKGWKSHPLNPKVADELAINWIFLVDALNFSFWSFKEKEKYMVTYAGVDYTGYLSLCAAINRAVDEGVPITSAEYCKNVSINTARKLFRSCSSAEIPMLEERVSVMNEVGTVLVEKFGGKFSNCVAKAEGSGQRLMKLVVENFPCFRDEAVFEGQRVSFYKRAQILVADLWACFEGEGACNFSDIDSITMFADYRIPQALVYFNVLSYSEEMMEMLKKDHMFESGDLMEMEIRAGSIWAVELLAERMNELLRQEADMQGTLINAVLLDHFLWDYRRKHDKQTKHIPFHKIRCVYY